MLEDLSDVFFMGFMLSGLVAGLFFTGGGMLASPGLFNAMNRSSQSNASIHNDATHFAGTHKNPKDIDNPSSSSHSIGKFFLVLSIASFVLFVIVTFVLTKI